MHYNHVTYCLIKQYTSLFIITTRVVYKLVQINFGGKLPLDPNELGYRNPNSSPTVGARDINWKFNRFLTIRSIETIDVLKMGDLTKFGKISNSEWRREKMVWMSLASIGIESLKRGDQNSNHRWPTHYLDQAVSWLGESGSSEFGWVKIWMDNPN